MVDLLPIFLFLLGISFIFLGWRWQNPPNEEALTALKGLAYLKREIIRVQDQVHELEGKLLEFKALDPQRIEQSKVSYNEKETKELETEEPEFRQLEPPQKVELYPHLSPKYKEVLELAANGQRIPEIAQRLVLSQDAVRMVLRMQPDGGNNS